MAEEPLDEAGRVRAMESRIGQAEIRALEARLKLESHEDLCAERYQRLEEKLDDGKSRFRRLEWMLVVVALAILGADPASDQLNRVIQAISTGG
jgi:hypothetical protein